MLGGLDGGQGGGADQWGGAHQWEDPDQWENPLLFNVNLIEEAPVPQDPDQDPIVIKLREIIKKYDEENGTQITNISNINVSDEEMEKTLKDKHLWDITTYKPLKYPITVSANGIQYILDAEGLLTWAQTRITTGKQITHPFNNEVVIKAENIESSPDLLNEIIKVLQPDDKSFKKGT